MHHGQTEGTLGSYMLFLWMDVAPPSMCDSVLSEERHCFTHTATELNNEEEVAMLEFRDAAVAGDAMDHGDEDYGIGYSGI